MLCCFEMGNYVTFFWCFILQPRERGRLRFHRLQNIKAALDFLTYQNVKLVNVHPEDVADGNPKITLGLIWTIILKFQVSAFTTGQQFQIFKSSLRQLDSRLWNLETYRR